MILDEIRRLEELRRQPRLTLASNAAITLRRPLFVNGESGTSQTMLAQEVASSVGMPPLRWRIRSSTKTQQGL